MNDGLKSVFRVTAALAILIFSLLAAGCAGGSVAVSARESYAFIHAEVLPMTEETVLHDCTVAVRDGVIMAVGPSADVKVPDGARVINANGAYLLPGLSDMHAHLPQYGTIPLSFLAYGVTTVRNMDDYHEQAPAAAVPLFALFGVPVDNVNVLALKKDIDRGRTPGPRVYTAGTTLNAPDRSPWPGLKGVPDPEKARKLVRRQKKAGYDFIKVYTDLSPDVYRAIVDEARKEGIPVVGHVPEKLGCEAMLELGGQKSVEHIDGTINTSNGEVGKAGASLAGSGVWFCPTLVVSNVMYPGETDTAETYVERLTALQKEKEARPSMKYADSRILAEWRKQVDSWKKESLAMGVSMRSFIRAATPEKGRALVEAYRAGGGRRLLTGTDAPTHYVLPGASLLEEFAFLSECGCSPYEILKASTVNAAAFLGEEAVRGIVAPGMQADLILTDGNPLKDLSALERLRGTMAAGRWYERTRLLDELEKAAR